MVVGMEHDIDRLIDRVLERVWRRDEKYHILAIKDQMVRINRLVSDLASGCRVSFDETRVCSGYISFEARDSEGTPFLLPSTEFSLQTLMRWSDLVLTEVIRDLIKASGVLLPLSVHGVREGAAKRPVKLSSHLTI